jgi:hypothetical protein
MRTTIQREVPILRAKLAQYIDDPRTRETLVGVIEGLVVQEYEVFFDEYLQDTHTGNANGTPATPAAGVGAGAPAAPKDNTKTPASTAPPGKANARTISRKGKSPESAVWDSETFTEWCQGIFDVTLPLEEQNGDGDEGGRSGSVDSFSRDGGD